MMDGDLLQLGPPNEVYENPQDIRVAEFIGSPKMNILPGKCDANGRITCLGLTLDEDLATPAPGSVSVGLRPEHLHVQPNETTGCFSGRLTYKENLGSDLFLHLDVDGCEQKIVVRAKPHEVDFAAIGETVYFNGEPEKLRVFGVDGKRVALTATRNTRKAG
jgi:multiple sugar transport system ATP-binding protein